jgi:Family of unknown function (DUF6088)
MHSSFAGRLAQQDADLSASRNWVFVLGFTFPGPLPGSPKCPKSVDIVRTGILLQNVRKNYTNIGQEPLMSDLSTRISSLIDAALPGRVWVPADFAPLGGRDVIDKTLQRMAASGQLRRIDRGLYDRPSINRLTKRPTSPDYRAVLDALARRDQLRMLVDGMTAANDLGLTDAVPARVTIHTDTRRRTIRLDNLVIEFKQTAPSRLYWAGRPAMRVVQALHWLKDTLAIDGDRIRRRLGQILDDRQHGPAIRKDLLQGFSILPAWMQTYLRTVPGLDPMPLHVPEEATSAKRQKRARPKTGQKETRQ